MKYFTMQECIYSDEAVKRGINNTQSPEIEKNIVESVETLLDPLREAWETYCKQNGLGKVGINISSGYRCPELNKAIHSSSTSAHMPSYAFDLTPPTGRCGRSSAIAANGLPETCLRPAYLRGRGRKRDAQLDARGLQTS